MMYVTYTQIIQEKNYECENTHTHTHRAHMHM